MKKVKLVRWSIAVLLLLNAACEQTDEVAEVTSTSQTPYLLSFPSNLTAPVIPADNPLTEEGVKLGRFLFYEKKLSANNKISCGSCHKQELAFSSGVALSKGTDGLNGTRNTMHLANIAWDTDLTWDGHAKTLEEQARTPITNHLEMNLPLEQAASKLQNTAAYPKLFMAAFNSPVITPDNIIKAIAQFERTLISADSRFDRYLRNQITLNADELEGLQLFSTKPVAALGIRGANCVVCHTGVLTGHKFANIGLDLVIKDKGLGGVTGNAADDGKFKVPSLQNVALTAPYMHDGRFNTLKEVLDYYNEHVDANSQNIDILMLEASNEVNGKSLRLTPAEKNTLIKFLKTFTDSAFVRNSQFSKIAP